jgi:hypothetical protein
MAEPLSPAAQKVLWAGLNRDSDRLVIAAALRAAADAIEPIDITPDHEWLLEQLRAIAAELEVVDA